MHTFEVLRRPLITEKSTILQDAQNKYAFEVDTRANKVQVNRLWKRPSMSRLRM